MMRASGEIYAFLDALGIEYQHMAHEPVHTIEDCAFAEASLSGLMPKNLFLTPRNRSAHVLCLVRPDARFRTSDVSKQLGMSRLSFAPDDALAQMLRTYPSAISPMGLVFPEAADVRLAVDARLLSEPRLLFHPNDNAQTLAMSNADFFHTFLHHIKKEPAYINI